MKTQCKIIWTALVWLMPGLGINQTSGQVPLPEAPVLAASSISLNQMITVSVTEISALSISGNLTLVVSNAVPGADPDPVVDTSASYSITANGSNKKLSGQVDADYSSGISLELLLTPPTGGTSQSIVLGTLAQDLASGFGYVAESGLTMTYTAYASTQVESNGSGELRTLTLTLTDN